MANKGCTDFEQPEWDVEFYAGNHEVKGVQRCLEKVEDHNGEVCALWDIITGEDPRIDNGVWVSYEDIEELQTEVLSKCEDWGKQMAREEKRRKRRGPRR